MFPSGRTDRGLTRVGTIHEELIRPVAAAMDCENLVPQLYEIAGVGADLPVRSLQNQARLWQTTFADTGITDRRIGAHP